MTILEKSNSYRQDRKHMGLPPFITLFSSRKTGRWFLLLSILFLLWCTFFPDLILRVVVSSQADFNRNGWQMYFSEPSHPIGVEKYDTFLPAGRIVALNPEFKKAKGYLLWEVPVSGHYIFKLEADDDTILSVDGKHIATMYPNFPVKQRIDTWVQLTKGTHLFQIQAYKKKGGGGFSVGMMTPPMMNSRILEGTDVAVPALQNIEGWWTLMELAHAGRKPAWICAAVAVLCLLLPLTMKNHPFSVVIFTGIAFVPALLIPVSVHKEPYIGKMIQQELEEKKPDFVFIGNSMLWSRIDDAYLGELLGGKKVFSIVNFGGLSAVHYLAFKYLLYPADIHPEKVFIFFRSNQFILPRARTKDPFVEKIIERLTPAPDPLFEQIVHGRSRSFTDKLYDKLLSFFPIAEAQSLFRSQLNRLALNPTLLCQSYSSASQPQQNILELVNKRFSFTSGSLRSDLDSGESLRITAETMNVLFKKGIEASFLPAILDLAEEKMLSLVFVRVQERPAETGPVPDSPELQKYMQNLRKYLKKHNAALYDFTGDPELPLSAYHDGDHIRDQKKYTELFSRRLREFLQ